MHHIYSLDLSHWLSRVGNLLCSFTKTTFHHIYKEYNSVADTLSKKVIDDKLGCIFFEELLNRIVINSGDLRIKITPISEFEFFMGNYAYNVVRVDYRPL